MSLNSAESFAVELSQQQTTASTLLLFVEPPGLTSRQADYSLHEGVNVKTRKRNVAIPHDPAGFADSVISLFQANCSQVEGVEAKLAAAGKALDTADLDFSRYGDTLFEIYFAGARMGIGAKLAGDENQRIDFNILACEPETKEILPFIKAFAGLLRRRPFLVKRLEAVVCKLLSSLEFFDADGRQKIAIATALMFTEKIGILPEEVLESLLNDRLVAKGTVLEVLTAIIREFLKHNSIDELIILLSKAKVAHRLLEFFPPGRQSEAAFAEHFKKEGLQSVVDWQAKKVRENAITHLHGALLEAFQAEEGVESYLEIVKASEDKIPKEEIVRVIWSVMNKNLNLIGKNQVQVLQIIVKQIKANLPLLQAHTTSAKLELQLLNCVQISCYEDNKLLKLFVDIVKVLYDIEVVGEDTILFWYKKGSGTKGRNVFLNDIEPFIKWLQETEAEDDDDDDDDEDDDDETD